MYMYNLFFIIVMESSQIMLSLVSRLKVEHIQLIASHLKVMGLMAAQRKATQRSPIEFCALAKAVLQVDASCKVP